MIGIGQRKYEKDRKSWYRKHLRRVKSFRRMLDTPGNPKVLLAKQYYSRFGMEAWTVSRIKKLCSNLKCTMFELGAVWIMSDQAIIEYDSGTDDMEVKPEDAIRFSIIEDAYERFIMDPPCPRKFPALALHVLVDPEGGRAKGYDKPLL